MYIIDLMSRTPVYKQIVDQTERFILTGVFKPGDWLPSVRGLANELSTNPNTIQKAFTDLDKRGIIGSAPGKGCFITERAVEILKQNREENFLKLYDIIQEFKLAGISKETIISYIERTYRDDSNSQSDQKI